MDKSKGLNAIMMAHRIARAKQKKIHNKTISNMDTQKEWMGQVDAYAKLMKENEDLYKMLMAKDDYILKLKSQSINTQMRDALPDLIKEIYVTGYAAGKMDNNITDGLTPLTEHIMKRPLFSLSNTQIKEQPKQSINGMKEQSEQFKYILSENWDKVLDSLLTVAQIARSSYKGEEPLLKDKIKEAFNLINYFHNDSPQTQPKGQNEERDLDEFIYWAYGLGWRMSNIRPRWINNNWSPEEFVDNLSPSTSFLYKKYLDHQLTKSTPKQK